jgi:hypothetical protein
MPVTINGSNTPTAGGITYGDGTTYANTAAGSSGQLLQSNGASAPSWVAAPTSAMTFITSVTANDSATVDLENAMSTYGVYMVVANQIITTGAANPTFRCQLKVGGAYRSDSFYSYQSLVPPTTTRADSAGPNMEFTASLAANQAVSFVMYVYSPSNTTNVKVVSWHGGFSWSGTGTPGLFTGAGGYTALTTAITGIRFFTSTNNLVSGTFRLYGIANS